MTRRGKTLVACAAALVAGIAPRAVGAQAAAEAPVKVDSLPIRISIGEKEMAVTATVRRREQLSTDASAKPGQFRICPVSGGLRLEMVTAAPDSVSGAARNRRSEMTLTLGAGGTVKPPELGTGDDTCAVLDLGFLVRLSERTAQR